MNKKGFTLVELLATILIIAILSLVAIPAINLVIKSVKKSGFKENAVRLLKVVQLDRNNSGRINDVDVSDEYIIDMENNAITLNNEKIDTKYNGEINGKGIIRIDEAERMSIIYSDGQYCAYKLFDETNVSITDGDCSDMLAAQCNETELNVIPEDRWSQYKIVKTNFTGGICGELFYSKNNKGYQRYQGQIKIEENNTLITLKTIGLDGKESISEKNITKIDRTAPTTINVDITTTAKRITLKANAEDTESGISVYAFSIDGGNTWSNYTSSNEYVIDNPASGTYHIMAKAYNGTYNSLGAVAEMGEKISTEQVITIEQIDCDEANYICASYCNNFASSISSQCTDACQSKGGSNCSVSCSTIGATKKKECMTSCLSKYECEYNDDNSGSSSTDEDSCQCTYSTTVSKEEQCPTELPCNCTTPKGTVIDSSCPFVYSHNNSNGTKTCYISCEASR